MPQPQNENPAQQCAIRHPGGPIQVLAGPGSGKTYTIVKRIRYLVEVMKIPPTGILVITFTKAAAKEMQSRFLTEIRHAYSAVNFGTFHSIYYQILSRSGYFQDFSLVTETEKRKIIRRLLQHSSPRQNADQAECIAVINEISRLKNKEEPSGQFLTNHNLTVIFNEYCDLLKSTRKFDFDDMIGYCYDLLTKDEKLLTRWQQYFTHLLVDEFQDINRLQYQVLKLLAAPDNQLFTVGDDDQSIYGFRGARPAVMKEFLADFPGCQQVILNINYRSTHPIVVAAEKVIDCNSQRLPKQCRALRDGSEVELMAFSEREKEDDYLLTNLVKILPEKRRETAVILRTNYEVSLMAVKCTERGIPVRVSEKIPDIFNHFIGIDMMDYLLFSGQEKTRARYLNIINKPMRYLSRNAVADLTGEITEGAVLRYYQEDIDGQSEVKRFFADCNRIARMSPFLALHFLRKGIGYDRYLKERAKPGEYEAWMEIADTLQESARGCRDFTQWYQLAENYSRLSHAQTSMPTDRSRNIPKGKYTKKTEWEKENNDTKNHEGIRLMTMHSAKGLEFHTVFLPHLNEGTLPNRKSLTAEQIEEERRLFYVGMTRAKENLILLYTASAKHTPSRFLEPFLPSGL